MRTLIWFWQVICVHTSLSVYLDESRNHATMTFCEKKFPFSYFRKPFLCLLYNEPFRYAYSCAHSEHGRMCVVMTNKWFSRSILNKYTLFPVSLNSPSMLLSSVNTSIKGHVKKKNCFGSSMYQCATCFGQMSKQFDAGAIKPEPGFCASGFGFFHSEPRASVACSAG